MPKSKIQNGFSPFSEKSSENRSKGKSTRKRKRSGSDLEIGLDPSVKWSSPSKSRDGVKNSDVNVSFAENSSDNQLRGVSSMKKKISMPEIQIGSPVKWTSPRRSINRNGNADADVISLEGSSDIGSRLVSPPKQKKSRSQSIPGSPLDSPTKWRSPRKSTSTAQNSNVDAISLEKSIEAGRRTISTPKWKKSASELMPEDPLDSPVKWRSPRRCANGNRSGDLNATSPEKLSEKESGEVSTPKQKKLRSNTMPESPVTFPAKWTSPRRCTNRTQNDVANGVSKVPKSELVRSPKSPRRRLLDHFPRRSKWNPRDSAQMNAVKEALHVSMAPSTIVCREEEQERVLRFCEACIKQEKAGSLYICGCPGTGKSLSMEKVKEQLVGWAKEEGLQPPDVLAINCTSLATTSEIFSKMLERYHPRKKINRTQLPLQHLQNLFSQKSKSSVGKMMLMIVDEMDYLITKDRAVLHDLFMLTTFPFSQFILIGIANAIDLADRFLPKLQSLNCKPMVVTFRAYSKEQILKILQQRLMGLAYDAFQPQALELCARKVAAASGDMRKALSVCRNAVEMLESELRDINEMISLSSEKASSAQPISHAIEVLAKKAMDIVRVDHMALSLSKTFKSVIVDTIQSLPQHQQIILCSAVKLFRRRKKDTNIGELHKSYSDICKTTRVPQASILEFSNMCRVLSDQGLLKLGQSREERLKRVTLQVDEGDIIFGLQGIRFFKNCLQ